MRSLTAKTAALVIASAVAGASCLSRVDAPAAIGTASAAIVGGDADVGDTAIVAVKDVANGSLCSGTLIAPTLVLTAAHCVDGIDASDLRVLVGNDSTNPDQTVLVASVASYPTYDGESDGIPGGVDLGVVTLAASLPLAPIPVATTTTDAALTGADVTVIGYGATDGTDNSGGGTRRVVTLAVTTVCSRLIEAGDSTANACVGDSGGAVLLGGELVAVVSGGHEGCASPTSFMRTDAHADWIAAVLAGNAAAPCSACVAPDSSCGAATETKLATNADADAGRGDAGTSAAPSGASHGCTTASARGDDDAARLLVVAFVALAWTRRRRLSSRARCSPAP